MESCSTYPQHLSTGDFLVSERGQQSGVIIPDLRVATLKFPGLPAGMKHRGVIATAEGFADVRQAEIG